MLRTLLTNHCTRSTLTTLSREPQAAAQLARVAAFHTKEKTFHTKIVQTASLESHGIVYQIHAGS
jgi:hypothetical protein